MSITNTYMEMQIVNQIQMVKNFNNSCLIASSKDDGKTSKEEQKILNQIYKASEDYIKKLNKIIL